MKKTISILLCLVLVLSSASLFSVSASAAEDALTVNVKSNVPELFPESSENIVAGQEQVTVTYWINTPGFDMQNCEFMLRYNPEYLEFDRTTNVNQTSRGGCLIIKPAIGENGAPVGAAMNSNITLDNGLAAIKANCTGGDTPYNTAEGGRTAFVSVTFNVLQYTGSTDVTLDLRVLSFCTENDYTQIHLVKNNQFREDTGITFETDKSYAAAYSGGFNEEYVPSVLKPEIVIQSSLTLSLNLTRTFYVKEDLIGDMTDPYLHLSYSDPVKPSLNIEKDIEGKLVTRQGVSYYAFEYSGINPQRMYDEYDVTVFANDDGIICYSPTYQMSVKKYIYEGFGLDPEKWYPLYVDLLNYGAATQKFKDYHADEPITGDLMSEPYRAYTQKYVAQADDKITNLEATDNYIRAVDNDEFHIIDHPEATYRGINLTLGNVISMHYYFELEDIASKYVRVIQKNKSGTVSTVDIPASEFVSQGGNLYYVNYDAMGAHQMRDLVYFTVVDSTKTPVGNTTQFSVESEVALSMQDQQSGNIPQGYTPERFSKLVALEKAMLVYGDSAAAIKAS